MGSICPKCTRKVGEKGIVCDGPCSKWFHPRCIGVPDAYYDTVTKLSKVVRCFCPVCFQLPTTYTTAAPHRDADTQTAPVPHLDAATQSEQSEDAASQAIDPVVQENEPIVTASQAIDPCYTRIVQGHKDPLSNFYQADMTFNNIKFKSAEHCYQYGSAIVQNKVTLAEEILAAPHAGRAKALSRNLDRPLDRNRDVRMMLDILQAKASQCAEFRKALRDSGKNELMHSTGPKDTFWATGLNPTDAPTSDCPGHDVFGGLLKIVRATLLPESHYKTLPKRQPLLPTPPGPPANMRAPPSFTDVVRKRQPAQESQLGTKRHTDVSCGTCGVPGHPTIRCRYKDRVIACYSCGKNGHKRRYCHLFNSPAMYEPMPQQNFRLAMVGGTSVNPTSQIRPLFPTTSRFY